MSDPTIITLQTCLFGALGGFVLTAIARALRAWFGRRPSTPPPLPLPFIAGETPAGTAASPPSLPVVPPALPVGRVAVWPYHVLDLIWMAFIFLTFFALSIGNARYASVKTEAAITPSVLVQSMAMQVVLAVMTIAVMIWRVRPLIWLGLRWPGWKWSLLIGPVGVAMMWLLSAALYGSGYTEWLESRGVEKMQDSVKLLQTTDDPLTLILMAVAAVIVAPLCEEVIFRGYLYAAAKRFAGPTVAGACSALVFAAAHGSLAPLIPLFFFGCLLVIAYERTGSLWAPITLHFCFNSATVVIQVLARVYNHPLVPDL